MARIKSARALRDKTRSSQNVKFANFFSIGWVWARFPRARTFSARHWICLIMKIIFDYWIVSVALKLAEIEAFQVIKKLNTFTPPCPESTADNTARSASDSVQSEIGLDAQI